MKSVAKMFFCCLRGEDEAGQFPKRLKMVVVGDGTCGKTCLLYRLLNDEFFSLYIPTVFEVQTKTTTYKHQEVEVVMYDTAGQEDYDRLRPFSYADTDVMVICYAVDNPDSLVNVLLNWVPEVRYFCGNIPILLVANKKDLRERKEIEHDYTRSHDAATLLYRPISSSDDACDSKITGSDGKITGSDGKIAGSDSSIYRPLPYDATSCSSGGKVDSALRTDPKTESNLSRTGGLQNISAAVSSCRSSSDSLCGPSSRRVQQTVVNYDEGLAVARKMDAFGYYECSAKTGDGCMVVLDAVVRAGMEFKQKKSTGLFRYKKSM